MDYFLTPQPSYKASFFRSIPFSNTFDAVLSGTSLYQLYLLPFVQPIRIEIFLFIYLYIAVSAPD
ncbi:MAG: hypothetical protein V8R00_07460 [Coprococcus catus]|nr:hypothetical protein [Coprococcus catus]